MDFNFITTKQLSKWSSYSESQVSRFCRNKKIESKKIGNTWTVEKAHALNFLEKLKEQKEEEIRSINEGIRKLT